LKKHAQRIVFNDPCSYLLAPLLILELYYLVVPPASSATP